MKIKATYRLRIGAGKRGKTLSVNPKPALQQKTVLPHVVESTHSNQENDLYHEEPDVSPTASTDDYARRINREETVWDENREELAANSFLKKDDPYHCNCSNPSIQSQMVKTLTTLRTGNLFYNLLISFIIIVRNILLYSYITSILHNI